MYRVCFLLTATPWHDRRQFDRQAPALADDGHELIYVAVNPDPAKEGKLRFVGLSSREGKRARLLGALNLFGKLKQLKPDAIQLCSIEQLPLGLALKLLTKIVVVYDCREDMYHSMRDHKMRFPRWFRQILAWGVKVIEWSAAKFLDGIVASDNAIYDSHKAAPDERKCLFYNTPLLSTFERNYEPLAHRKYDIVVMGSMSPRTGVLDIIEAVGMLKSQGMTVSTMLLGEPGPDVIERLNARMNELGIGDQVHITGMIPHLEVPKTLSMCKIGIVPLPDMPKFRSNIACKAFEYMACGMPVVCTDLPPQRVFVEEGKNGFFYEPGNVEQLAGLLKDLLSTPSKAQAVGEHGRKSVEESWNCERDQEKLRHFYRTLLAHTSQKKTND